MIPRAYLFCFFLFSGSIMASEPVWEQISEADGIEVFKYEVPDSPIVAFKGRGIVPASISKVASVILDTNHSTEWVDRLVENKVIRVNPDQSQVIWNHLGTPFVIKDRDFVYLSKVETDLKARTLRVTLHSVEDPLAPKTDYIRGEIHDSSFFLESLENDTQTRLTCTIHSDLKGSVAKWIINMFQKTWPRNTIEAVRKQAQKPDLQVLPFIKNAFPAL